MGSGKTTVAALLHKKLSRSALVGIDRIKWFVSGFTRSPKDNRMTAEVVLAMCKVYGSHGLGIIVEQGFMRAEFMLPFLKLAKGIHRKALIYQVTAPHEVLLARVAGRPKPLHAKTKISRRKTLRNIKLHALEKYALPRKIFDSSRLSPQQIVNKIIKDIRLT